MNLELELKERVARRAIQLLPQPQAAIRLRNLVADPAHTRTQVVDTIKLDPMLAAAVLRVANSAAYSRGSSTGMLAFAITRIGEKELSRLALAAGLGAASNAPGPLLALRAASMHDALTSALLCERLAPEFGLEPEALFTMGLLHDVGTLVALGTLELILAQHPKAPPLEADIWLSLAQAHHLELGRVLAQRWSLPAGVAEAIERHHQPDDGARDAVSVVRLSDVLLELLNAGSSLEGSWLSCIEASRRLKLLESLASVPALVVAFQADKPALVKSELVAKPPPVQTDGASFPVRVTGGRIGEIVLLSECTMLLRTSTSLPENHLEEVGLALHDGVIQLWVRVTRSTGADGRFEAEATLFDPSTSVAQRIGALFASTGAQVLAA